VHHDEIGGQGTNFKAPSIDRFRSGKRNHRYRHSLMVTV
jgi:hypothetical protein